MEYLNQSILLSLLYWLCVDGVKQDICDNEEHHASCSSNEVILMERAIYGRMRLGHCVKNDLGHLGCQNDVLPLVDSWCSGRKECRINLIDNIDLVSANQNCLEDLKLYMEIQYNCVEVSPYRCPNSGQRNIRVSGKEGYISSHVTKSPGCGTNNVFWEIRAQAGQTVDLWLLDFSALQRQRSGLYSGCMEPYGYILERALSVNHSLCGGLERQSKVYTSKTNTVEIHFISPERRNPKSFMVQYSLVGCSDLTPPAEAWYKREGSEAVIGCKSNDRVWRLSCHGNTWDGVVGNCSDRGSTATKHTSLDFSFSSVIFLTGVVCAAFLLVIVVVVAGSVYIKKQSIKHEIKLRSDYSAATLSPSQYYTVKPGYTLDSGSTMQQPVEAENQSLVQIWDRSLSARTQSHAGHASLNPNNVTRNQSTQPGIRQQDLMH